MPRIPLPALREDLTDDAQRAVWDSVVAGPRGRVIGPLRAAAKTRPAKVIHIASLDGVSANPMETYPYAARQARSTREARSGGGDVSRLPVDERCDELGRRGAWWLGPAPLLD